jgi:dipeptidyl aminopeptidase/acylaminoacyl peptidase
MRNARSCHLLAAIAILLCSGCLGQANQTITLEDLQSLKYVDDQIELSPDGATLAYAVADALWMVPTIRDGVPRAVGKGRMPRWSPDGSHLAFYSNESGTLQLWVMDVRSGQRAQITNVDSGITPIPGTARYSTSDPLRYGWSPDGSRLAFTSQTPLERSEKALPAPADRSGAPAPLVLTVETPPSWTLSGLFRYEPSVPQYRDGRFTTGAGSPSRTSLMTNQVFIVDIATNRVRQLTADSKGCFNPDWSPNGRYIACSSSEGKPLGRVYRNGFSNIYLIDVSTGDKTAITSGPGDKYRPAWSPDGKWIAYLGLEYPGIRSVFIIPRTGSAPPVKITALLDRRATDFSWSSDSRSVLVIYRDGVSQPIARVDVTTGNYARVTPDESYDYAFTLSRSGLLAWVQGDAVSVGTIRILPGGATNSYALVNINPQIHQWTLGAQEVVRWKNSRGEEIEGILIKPVGYQEGRRYPLIVDPYSVFPFTFLGGPMNGNQAFASRGYAVFLPNYRAPHRWQDLMKNEAYSRVARGPSGWDIALDDVMSGVDTLIKRGVVDPERMGLYGFSNGGGATNYLVTRTDRFKCAVSAAGIYADWARWFFMSTDESLVPDLAGGVLPWERPGTYTELSPVFHLDRVNTPMLLAVGDKDRMEFILDSIEMFNGLRWLNRDVTLLRYSDQGHGFSGEALKDYWERVNAFFDQHLKLSSSDKVPVTTPSASH